MLKTDEQNNIISNFRIKDIKSEDLFFCFFASFHCVDRSNVWVTHKCVFIEFDFNHKNFLLNESWFMTLWAK